MVKSSNFERKIRCKKAKLCLFVMENPLCTFAQILKNGNVTKNKVYLKKYLEELIQAKTLHQVPFKDKYYTSPILEEQKNNISLALLSTLIKNNIYGNPHVFKNHLFRKIYGVPSIEFQYHQMTDNSPLSERVLAKYYILWNLKLRILEMDLKQKPNVRDDKTWKKIQANIDGLIRFGYDLQSFLDNYNPNIPIRKLEHLEREFDTTYELDIIYMNKLLYGTRPLSEIIRVAIEEQVKDIKEASRMHLQIRRKSAIKHGKLPEREHKVKLDRLIKGSKAEFEKEFPRTYEKMLFEEARKYPVRQRKTKDLIENIADSGKPNEMKLLSYYFSEMGRINRPEIPYDVLKFYISSCILRNFIRSAPNTPKNLKLKKQISEKFKNTQLL